MQHLEIDVLTVAPQPVTQHALIKFLGPDKCELGQGVISVRSDTLEEISFPFETFAKLPTNSSPPSPSLRGTWSASSGSRGSSSDYKDGQTTAPLSSSAAVVIPSRPRCGSNGSDVGSISAAYGSGGESSVRCKKKSSCQTVTLFVGGAFGGTVKFACDVKIRFRAKDGGQLQVPEESNFWGEKGFAIPRDDSFSSSSSIREERNMVEGGNRVRDEGTKNAEEGDKE